jgi:hypothetical protein
VKRVFASAAIVAVAAIVMVPAIVANASAGPSPTTTVNVSCDKSLNGAVGVDLWNRQGGTVLAHVSLECGAGPSAPDHVHEVVPTTVAAGYMSAEIDMSGAFTTSCFPSGTLPISTECFAGKIGVKLTVR